jgi:histidinol-phosphate aminotransferase
MMNPSFAMYGFYATINENKVVQLNLNENFEIVKDDFLNIINDEPLKVFFLCSPNNPTGNSMEDVEFYLQNFNGIVVVDEAYIEFSGKNQVLNYWINTQSHCASDLFKSVGDCGSQSRNGVRF